MLVLDMIYVNWIVENEKSKGPLRCLSHALGPLGFVAWQAGFLNLNSPLSAPMSLIKLGASSTVTYPSSSISN